MALQKYYYYEHLAGYGRMEQEGLMSWGQVHGRLDDFTDFSSKSFLEGVLPRLGIPGGSRVLELGCGTGPGACFLAERVYLVHGIDLIPAAIAKAREIARERNLPITYAVTDVCQIPRSGEPFDLIVDSYCTQGIVTDADRALMFEGIRANLAPQGYFLMTCCVFERHRIDPGKITIDHETGIRYVAFDNDDLWDGEREITYNRFQIDPLRPDVPPDAYEGSRCINGEWYVHRRLYRTPETLRLELERNGFKVLEQNGDIRENAICIRSDADGVLGM